MRQTGFVHLGRDAALAGRYDQTADIYRRSDAPESDIGSAFMADGTRREIPLHSDVPCYVGQTRGIGEQVINSATIGTTNFTVGLRGMYNDIQERDEVEIDNVRYNIKSVGVQRLAERTRLRVERKDNA